MDSSLYVLRNDANAHTFRHETLDEALDALNYEVGARDLWVLVELDRAGAGRLVAEGSGAIDAPPSIALTRAVRAFRLREITCSRRGPASAPCHLDAPTTRSAC
jgi:hypothetical protein